MSSELQKEFSKAGSPDVWETFSATLSNFAVVDVGKILAIKDGIATVQTYYVKGRDTKRVQAEIVMPGNLSGYLGTIDPGQPCIVFYPRSPSASLAEEKIDTTYGVYNERAAKCLPVATFTAEQLVTISHQSEVLSIASDGWSLNFDKDGIVLLSEVFKLLLKDTFTFGTESTQVNVADDGTVEVTSGREYDSVNDVFNWKNCIEVKPDGSVKVQAAGLKDSTNQSFGKSQIEMDIEGNVKIKAGVADDGTVQSELNVMADGTINITTQQQYGITGISGVMIDGQDGKVSIKNSGGDVKSLLDSFADSVQKAFDDLKTVLDSLQTAGSPANHTAVPGQFDTWQSQTDQAVGDWKDSMAEVLE